MRIQTHTLGFPRIGVNRTLKKAQEAFWKDPSGRQQLLQTAAQLRRENWERQRDAGIDLIPSNDFSMYDHMLDHACLLGCVPERYFAQGRKVAGLDEYFSMARGNSAVHAMEMTKWLDTNYHYIVPELTADQTFQLASTKPFDEFREALAMGIRTKPVFPGPVSFLRLAKARDENFDLLTLLPRLVPVYVLILQELHNLGAEWVQLDEPVLAMDMTPAETEAIVNVYRTLAESSEGLSLMVCSYFGAYGSNLKTAMDLPVQALHLDACRAGEELEAILKVWPTGRMLSLGVVDGRNVWKNDYARSLDLISQARGRVGALQLMIAPSCSLLHAPVSLEDDEPTPAFVKPWLSFACEKLTEVATLARLAQAGNWEHDGAFRENQADIASRFAHPAVRIQSVRDRASSVRPADVSRLSPFAQRIARQNARLGLPVYPTTTIGSFPQTSEVRRARAQRKKGLIGETEYQSFLESETRAAVKRQEDLGLDVLVHGEFERNDMVEFFGENLDGFAFTSNGWVQSYGSRCVKPPIIYGDVFRARPMTLGWTVFAMKQTDRPMKGMLTGPVTILKWSFVRDDQPLDQTADQIALAIRDEVVDLEAAGLPIIQIDEPALREALPLRRSEWESCLAWEVRAFKLSASGVRDETQIHTHMCYCDFGEIMGHIADMDADVISLEASRSRMELLESFKEFRYPNGIGPGVWDIHSPRVPTADEMEALLRKAAVVLRPENLWVNPDCGLKTRGWEETSAALKNMVEAARRLRG